MSADRCPDCRSKDNVIRTMSRAREYAQKDADKWQAVAYRLADELAAHTEHNAAYWLDSALEAYGD